MHRIPHLELLITYYLKDGYQTKRKVRQEADKKRIKAKQPISFPGWDTVESERRQEDPAIWLTIRDNENNIIKRIAGPTKKGFHRVAWDLRYPAYYAIDINRKNQPDNPPTGILVAPGTYSATLAKEIDGVVTELAGPVPIEVVQMRKGALEGAAPEAVAAFWKRIFNLQRSVSAASLSLRNTMKKIKGMATALARSNAAPGALDQQLHQLRSKLMDIDEKLNGNRSKREVGEKYPPTVLNRISHASIGTSYATYGPTPAHQQSMDIAEREFSDLRSQLNQIIEQDIPQLEARMTAAGAPWIEGQIIPEP